MVEAASWERMLWVTPEKLDPNEWLFNCGSGTVDLRTGKLKSHDRKDLITKLANTEYRERSRCPIWRKFLAEIFSRNEV